MTTNDQKVLVVIPAYNEAGRIGEIVQSVMRVMPFAKTLVVNDCSSDDTGHEATTAGATVISHPINLGYGASLETGYFYALRSGFEFVIQMDGDGQHIADEIHKIFLPVANGEADIAIGSRYLSSETDYKTSFTRRVGQKFFGAIFSTITRYNLTDPTSGFQCLNRRVFELFASGNFPHDFPDTDVLLMAHYAGFRVKELPVIMMKRSGGVSMHEGLKPLYYIIKMILSIIMVVLSRRRWKQYAT
jgi:hypothetical protein